MKNYSHVGLKRGFTIVELLIVIVVIAILATITILSYNGVKKNAAISLAKDTLRSASTAMLHAGVETGTYPSLLPDTIKPPTSIGLALAETASSTTFCINVTSSTYSDIQWHVELGGELTQGLCSGDVIVASIIGAYQDSTPPLPADASGSAASDDGLLKVKTNSDWSSVTVSWTNFDSKPYYQLQTKSSVDETWYEHQTSNGSYDYTPPQMSAGRSGSIPSSQLSVTWTSSLPAASGVSYVYRIRSHEGGGANPGPWHTSSALVAPDEHTYVPAMKSFSVTPDATWSSINVAWQLPALNSVPRPIVHLQTKGPDDIWYEHETNNGTYTYTPPQLTTGRTGNIPITTTSLNWSSRIPSASGQVYQYRIGITDSRFTSVASPWSYITLTGPGAEVVTSPVQNFTVSQVSNWASIALSWTAPASGLENIPGAVYEIQTMAPGDTQWYEHQTSNGSYDYTPPQTTTGRTGNIPITTTNLNWTSRKPTSSGQTYQYRIRVWSTRFTDAHSDWATFSLTRP